MRRLVRSVALAAILLVVLVPAAAAAPRWCEDDPAVRIVTLSGTRVVVHVTNFGQVTGDVHHQVAVRQALAAAQIWYVDGERQAETRDGVLGTAVTLYVQVPAAVGYGPFYTYSQVGTRPHGDDLAPATAPVLSGGQPIQLRIWVPDR
jgi:hypothetical protein